MTGSFFAKILFLRTVYFWQLKRPDPENESEIESIIGQSYGSYDIRHTFDRTSLLDDWETRIHTIGGIEEKKYDNNKTQFSASLFATNLSPRANQSDQSNRTTNQRRSRQGRNKVPNDLEQPLKEMGFSTRQIEKAFKDLVKFYNPNQESFLKHFCAQNLRAPSLADDFLYGPRNHKYSETAAYIDFFYENR